MNPWKRTTQAAQPAGPDPGYDVTNGEPVYGVPLATMIENPPHLLLAPSSAFMPVTQLGTPGRGPENAQQFQSGFTNNIQDNPADTQGEGRAPGWRWARMPHVQQFNPTREIMGFQDGGGYHAFFERAQRQPIWPEGYLNYDQQPHQHATWPGIATVNQPEIPAFVEFVPPITPGGW